jgi:hypothetical protein
MRNGVDDLSDTEKEYYNLMVKLCANIASQFEEVELEEN